MVNVGDRVYASSAICSGKGTVFYIAKPTEMFPLQVALDNGGMSRFKYAEVEEITKEADE